MAGFKQWRVSDGYLADVLILSTQEPVQLTALHKSIQSTGYFGGKAPMSPLPSASKSSLTAKTTRALSGNQSRFLADPEVLRVGGGGWGVCVCVGGGGIPALQLFSLCS